MKNSLSSLLLKIVAILGYRIVLQYIRILWESRHEAGLEKFAKNKRAIKGLSCKRFTLRLGTILLESLKSPLS